MSTAVQTARGRVCQSAMGAATILRIFAKQQGGDWAWGLHQMVDDASKVAVDAMDSDDLDVIEAASLRYAKTNAVFSQIAHESTEDLLLTAEALLDATKDLIDAEAARLMAAGVKS